MVKYFCFFSFILLLMYSCRTHYKIDESATRIKFVEINKENIPAIDTFMFNKILPYKLELSSLMEQKVAFCEQALERSQPNGSLNNLAADMVFDLKNQLPYPVDFCLLNYGGLRSKLPAGNISRGDIFQLMPFENKVVVLKIKASIVDSIAANNDFFGGHPIAGISFTYLKNGLCRKTINDKDVDPQSYYHLITSDYLAQGGDKMSFLANADSIYETNISIRDAFFMYLKKKELKNENLKADFTKRIIYE